MALATNTFNDKGEESIEIDWAYFRKGRTSCKRAQEFLERRQVAAKTVVDACKTKIDAGDAWELLQGAKAVIVTKVKKVLRFEQVADEKEAILQQVMGPSGNLRAPTYRLKDEFIIGFNAELYEETIK